MPEELFEVEAATGGDGPEAGSVTGAAVVLRLHVQPGAGRSAVAGRHGDALRLRVAPPPADGRANEAVVGLVGELLDVPSARIELVSGERSREKRVRVRGVEPAEVSRLLDEALARAAAGPGRGARGSRRGR